jgi:hypothetical protein
MTDQDGYMNACSGVQLFDKGRPLNGIFGHFREFSGTSARSRRLAVAQCGPTPFQGVLRRVFDSQFAFPRVYFRQLIPELPITNQLPIRSKHLIPKFPNNII